MHLDAIGALASAQRQVRSVKFEQLRNALLQKDSHCLLGRSFRYQSGHVGIFDEPNLGLVVPRDPDVKHYWHLSRLPDFILIGP